VNLATIRAALYDALTVLDGLTVYRTIVDSPAPPCLMIDTPLAGAAREVFEDSGRRPTFPLILLAPANDPESATDFLDAYLSTDTPESIEAALEDSDLICRVVEYGLIDVRRANAVSFYGVEIHVEVWA
jgi:hypothetical protein